MEETTSPPAHSCTHCVDIVFPGSPEKIYVSEHGLRKDEFHDLNFGEETADRLDLSLADLILKANAGCDFAQYLKDEIERDMYRDTNPDAIHLYTQRAGDHIVIEPLICLHDLHLPDDVCEGRDVSRCFVTSGSVNIRCVLTTTSGKSLVY
jgi:hypothetical protein